MLEHQAITKSTLTSEVLVIDYDRYLTPTSEKRLQSTLTENNVTVEHGDALPFGEVGTIFLLVEHATGEVLHWIESVLARANEARVLVVTIGRPNASLIPYLSSKLNGILSLHSLYTYGTKVLDAVDEHGVYLEQGLHNDLVRQLHEQKLRDRPIKRLILREEEVLYRLTKNERTVLQHILDGHNNRKIAELMYLAPSTVSTVISHLLKKLEANDRTDAMVRIIRNGWVDAVR